MGSHQSSRGMNLENGWLYLTQHFHSISSDNMNIIIRKPLICCKASTLHIPVQHWWLMKVSALKTISMNEEDKEKCPPLFSECVKSDIIIVNPVCVLTLWPCISQLHFLQNSPAVKLSFYPPSLTHARVVTTRDANETSSVTRQRVNLASKNLYSILEFDWNWKRVVKEIGPNNRVRVFVSMVRYLSIRKYEVREIGYFAI